jgi:hypothetical protein
MIMIGNKTSVHTYLNYVVIVSPPLAPSASANSATVRKHLAGNPNTTEVTKVTIFDLANKIVAYSGMYEEGIREVFEGWGELFILGNDGKVGRYFTCCSSKSNIHSSTSFCIWKRSRLRISSTFFTRRGSIHWPLVWPNRRTLKTPLLLTFIVNMEITFIRRATISEVRCSSTSKPSGTSSQAMSFERYTTPHSTTTYFD